MEVVLRKRDEIEAERFDLLQKLAHFTQCALIVVRILAGEPAFEFGGRGGGTGEYK